jgi:hypothetical protein
MAKSAHLAAVDAALDVVLLQEVGGVDGDRAQRVVYPDPLLRPELAPEQRPARVNRVRGERA